MLLFVSQTCDELTLLLCLLQIMQLVSISLHSITINYSLKPLQRECFQAKRISTELRETNIDLLIKVPTSRAGGLVASCAAVGVPTKENADNL